MAERIVKQTIVLSRDGKRVVPPIGKRFNFTADEIKSIESVNSRAIEKVGDEDVPLAKLGDEDVETVSGEPGTSLGDTARDGDTSGGSGTAAKATAEAPDVKRSSERPAGGQKAPASTGKSPKDEDEL